MNHKTTAKCLAIEENQGTKIVTLEKQGEAGRSSFLATIRTNDPAIASQYVKGNEYVVTITTADADGGPVADPSA